MRNLASIPAGAGHAAFASYTLWAKSKPLRGTVTALLEDLLIYARTPAQERDQNPVDMNRVVDETLLLCQATLKKKDKSQGDKRRSVNGRLHAAQERAPR